MMVIVMQRLCNHHFGGFQIYFKKRIYRSMMFRIMRYWRVHSTDFWRWSQGEIREHRGCDILNVLL